MIDHYQTLIDLISDPIAGPYEGEDFFIYTDTNLEIGTHDVKTAAMIMRKVNSSGYFPSNLVKTQQSGGCIVLGFDETANTPAVFTEKIGFQKSTLAEIKKDSAGKFCIYINNKRIVRMYSSLYKAKIYVRKLNKELLSLADTESFEEYED